MSEERSQVIAATRAVVFGYRDAVVIDGVDLEVHSGDRLFLIGPNGAGKSTLLKLLGGLLTPQRGQVELFGEPPANRRRLARRLAYVPQSYSVSFPFTATEIVLMGRYPHHRAGVWTLEGDTDLERAEAAMERCEVLDLRDRRFGELSGGEQRRVLLAQAMCQEADLLLLDEPTASLDPAHGIRLFEALARMPSHVTVVVVSHDLNLTARFASRVAVLDHGRLVSEGEPLTTLQSDATRASFGVTLTVGTHPDGATPFVVPL